MCVPESPSQTGGTAPPLRPNLEVEVSHLLPSLLRRHLRCWGIFLDLLWRPLWSERKPSVSCRLFFVLIDSTVAKKWLQEWLLKVYWVIACERASRQVPAIRPRNVRKMTVTSGNQEDRGRDQLDQVSPLQTDSFFPCMCVCLRKGVCLNGFSSLSIFTSLTGCCEERMR